VRRLDKRRSFTAGTRVGGALRLGIAVGLAAALVLGASLAVVPAADGASGSSWPACVSRSAPTQIGIREVRRTRDGRLLTLQLRSAAMGDVEPVDVLLPPHYDASGRTRYHVLYLLHGAGGDYRSWIDGKLTPLLGDLPVITVMPNGSEHGHDGNYTDWTEMPVGDSARAPAWETYHIRELVPFIDWRFPTISGPAGHAVAGISMGGGGATKYAAEYPGTFGYAGTFSGEAHPLLPLALTVQNKTCRWGDPATHQVIWRDNDSADLAHNLYGVRVFIRSGNGTPGPYDSPTEPSNPVAALIRRGQLGVEYGAHLENEALLAGLHAVHAVVNARFFPGSHSLPYWQRDMREFVAWLRVQLRHPPLVLRRFSVASAHTTFTAWGWSFQAIRRVREFAYITVDGDRIRATGSGVLAASTPPRFHPRERLVVELGGRRVQLRADRHGVISFRLDLGPSHTRQQTAFGRGALHGWRTAHASIRPA
jgi:diacylglycerol O-acyltransferase/trehalose O-mycolyltransferase